MTKHKYTVSTRETQFGLEPIIKFENGVVTCPSNLISTNNNVNMLLKYVDWYIDEIYRQATDDANNYGLCFYACGYDGNAQQEEMQSAKQDGIHLF